VKDVQRAKKFYGEGLGWPIQQDYGDWVAFSLNDGALLLGIYSVGALAADTGAAADGKGFNGVTLSYLVRDEPRVAEMLRAERAGGKIAKPAERAQWGGTNGYFADPDGYLWKVASGTGEQWFAE
jgi:predicted enzyme related to lactoylglutathione lyase